MTDTGRLPTYVYGRKRTYLPGNPPPKMADREFRCVAASPNGCEWTGPGHELVMFRDGYGRAWACPRCGESLLAFA